MSNIWTELSLSKVTGRATGFTRMQDLHFAKAEAMTLGVHAVVTTAFLEFEQAEVTDDADRNDRHPAKQGGDEEVKRTIIHTCQWRS